MVCAVVLLYSKVLFVPIKLPEVKVAELVKFPVTIIVPPLTNVTLVVVLVPLTVKSL